MLASLVFVQLATESVLFRDVKATEKWLSETRQAALAIGYSEGGRVKYAKVFGRAAPNLPATGQTIFNVASLTKPVTALITLKLVAEGKWSLDQPLNEIFADPDLVNSPNSSKITTRLVLTHQTGFPNWRRQLPGRKLGFIFEPGTKFGYSGEGYEYLRRALEKKFGKSLESLAVDILFKPLRMKDTHYVHFAGWRDQRLAKPFDDSLGVYKIPGRTEACGADDLLTTLDDYTIFASHVLSGAGLPRPLYEEMIKPAARVKEGKASCLGWFIDSELGNGEYALMHGGADSGVRTIAVLLPKSRRSLVLITNSDNGVSSYEPAIKAFLGDSGRRFLEIETRDSRNHRNETQLWCVPIDRKLNVRKSKS